MLKTDGIYGGRFSGVGFDSCCMEIVDPDNTERKFKEQGDIGVVPVSPLSKFAVEISRQVVEWRVKWTYTMDFDKTKAYFLIPLMKVLKIKFYRTIR